MSVLFFNEMYTYFRTDFIWRSMHITHLSISPDVWQFCYCNWIQRRYVSILSLSAKYVVVAWVDRTHRITIRKIFTLYLLEILLREIPFVRWLRQGWTDRDNIVAPFHHLSPFLISGRILSSGWPAETVTKADLCQIRFLIKATSPSVFQSKNYVHLAWQDR